MPAHEHPFRTAPAATRDTVPVSPGMLHDEWVIAETDAELALAAWCSAPRSGKAVAYAAYVAALDSEEAVAALLEGWLAARRCPASCGPHVPGRSSTGVAGDRAPA